MPITNVFREVQFPADISYGSKGGSGFNTTIFETTGGFEQRNINWSRPRGEWDVSHGIHSRDDMDDLIAFFMAMQGKAYAFRFKDWADYKIANMTIGTGNGSNRVFQLSKTYLAGGNASYGFTRIIKKPVAGTLQTVTVNGSSAPFSVDITTGLITMNNAPTNGAAVNVVYAEFDVPVRFDTDALDVQQDYWNTESWNSIKVKEVRLS